MRWVGDEGAITSDRFKAAGFIWWAAAPGRVREFAFERSRRSSDQCARRASRQPAPSAVPCDRSLGLRFSLTLLRRQCGRYREFRVRPLPTGTVA